MTVLLAALALVGPRVVEVPIVGSGVIAVAAYAHVLAPLSSRQLAALHVLGAALLDGTKEMSRDQTRALTSTAGAGLKVSVTPGLIGFRFTVRKGELENAGIATEGLMLRPALTDAAIEEAKLSLATPDPSPIRHALMGVDLNFKSVRPIEVRSIASIFADPANSVVCLGGDFSGGDALREMVPRLGTGAVRPFRADLGERPVPINSLGGGVSIGEVRLGTWKPSRGAARLLAFVALGTGKSSSLARVLREREGLTYWQQGILWPNAEGWGARLMLARGTTAGDELLAHQARELLASDVDSWDSEVLERASVLLQESLTGEFPMSPFWISAAGPAGATLADRCAMRAIAELHGGTLGMGIESVDLADMKAAATEMLGEAETWVYRGG